jgi:hypothetical protein
MSSYATLQPTQFCAVPCHMIRALVAGQWSAEEGSRPSYIRYHFKDLLRATVTHGGSREVARNVLLALREIARLDRAFAARMTTDRK